MSATPTLVVAGLSARLLAEAAARDGYRVLALDAFGDLDTQRCAAAWHPVGAAVAPGHGPRLDAARTLAALQAAAREPGVLGWVAGSDFECEPELLARAAAVLPLIGTPPEAVRRVREPVDFFGTLAAHGLPHPETRPDAPADPRGWLRKCARGTGGWHIRAAGDARGLDPARAPYHQRAVAGTPMSVLFAADGAAARRLGVQRLIVRPLGAHPFVFRGAVGPLALPPARLAELDAALQVLASDFGLRGLAGLDFVDDGERAWLLELNPRPTASLALYGAGWMRAHVEAALHGRLPAAPPAAAPAVPLRGTEIVFARAPLVLDAAGAAALAARADCHDLPAAGCRFEAGDPVCSVEAEGVDVEAVLAALAAKRQALRAAWAAA